MIMWFKPWSIAVKGEHSGLYLPMPWLRFWSEAAAQRWIESRPDYGGEDYGATFVIRNMNDKRNRR